MDDEARDTIQRFHDALNRRDLDALGDLITDDCVFDATSPAPDGTRHVGRQAVLEACRVFFAESPAAHFEMEEMFGAGDRVVVRFTGRGRHTGSLYGESPTATDVTITGITIYRFEDGAIAEDWEAVDEHCLRRQVGAAPAD